MGVGGWDTVLLWGVWGFCLKENRGNDISGWIELLVLVFCCFLVDAGDCLVVSIVLVGINDGKSYQVQYV